MRLACLVFRVASRTALLLLAAAVVPPGRAEVRPLPVTGFAFDLEVSVAGTPVEAFDAFTRDTIEWWDHHFSPKPVKLTFEPRPGGGFLEIFDDSGNGARHATVIYADRGKRLRFTGPLGLSGFAVDLVHTLDFEPAEGGTRIRLQVQATGAIEEGWPKTVEDVWRHFLVERFQPYMASRARPAGLDSGEEHPRVRIVRSYREARRSGDVEKLRSLLAEDARMWFETREGPGQRVDPAAGGPWHDWDQFFRSHTTAADFAVEGNAVRVTITEINDWYRLVDRPPSQYYMTYWLDAGDRIQGILIHQIPGRPTTKDRLDEFKAWAREAHPGLVERLMPGGKLDPALEKAKLWKESLLEWRAAAGLPSSLEEAR